MKTVIQQLVYAIIQFPLIPLAIIGVGMIIYREHVVAKRLGVSPTTLGALGNKWLLHHFGTRSDPDTVAFCKALPMVSHYGLWAAFGGGILSHRLVGYMPSIGSIPKPGTENLTTFQNSKTMEFDRVLKEHVDGVEQVVVLGAGFDLRVSSSTAGKSVRVFELDLPEAQNLKLDALAASGIPHSWVTYIPVDFNADSWATKLCESGFDSSKPTLFLAESVMPYLSEAMVRKAIEQIAVLSAPGSVLAKDFFSTEFVDGLKKMSKTLREQVCFSVGLSGDAGAQLQSFFESSGFELTRVVLYGEETKKARPFCAITTVIKA